MNLNVICGMPRSGSTLFCNILNQNNNFLATTTSSLPQTLNAISQSWTNSIEIRNLLEKQKEETEDRMLKSMKSFVDSWYQKDNKKVIFDKSRGWNNNCLMLKHLYPDSKIIIFVRDLRNIFASVEKQHRKNPLVEEIMNPLDKTILSRADKMFSAEGFIGSCINGIEDIIRRNPPGLIIVQYEAFCMNPKSFMQKIYKEIGEEYFEHDFENIKNTSIDCDGHYLNKFPHKGEGKVIVEDPEEWKKYISKDLAEIIVKRFPDFNNNFGYK